MTQDTLNSYHIGVIRHFQQLERGFQKRKVVKLGVCSAARKGIIQVCDEGNRKINANNTDFAKLDFEKMKYFKTIHALVKKNNTQENCLHYDLPG